MKRERFAELYRLREAMRTCNLPASYISPVTPEIWDELFDEVRRLGTALEEAIPENAELRAEVEKLQKELAKTREDCALLNRLVRALPLVELFQKMRLIGWKECSDCDGSGQDAIQTDWRCRTCCGTGRVP